MKTEFMAFMLRVECGFSKRYKWTVIDCAGKQKTIGELYFRPATHLI